MSSKWVDLEAEAISKIGSLLATKRWACASPAERKAQGKMLAAARKRARKVKGAK